MKSIFDKIIDMKIWLNSKNIKMIIEPGRFIAALPIKLESEIINVYNDNIIINCSVYNSANDTFVANIRLLVEGELPEGKGEPYTIKGSTPCSMDIFRYRVFLKKPKVGDKIIFLNAGAYNYSSDFCNLEKLKTIIVD
jgi:ornithine decarboxylase